MRKALAKLESGRDIEEKVGRNDEQANATEHVIEVTRLEATKLATKKEDAALHYHQCLENIPSWSENF